MRLFTLIAGYAAGLAVAMKYRKDAGTSKLTTPTKSTIDSFFDEIVDIHKSAFTDVKSFAKENFDDIDNWDDLQSKVSGVISDFTANLDTHIETAKQAGTTKKAELLKIAQEFYTTHEATLESAKARASSFSGIPESTIDSWIATARTELTTAYSAIEKKFQSGEAIKSPAKKSTAKTPAKKPVAKKAPAPKTPTV
jgi:hypothetical protein